MAEPNEPWPSDDEEEDTGVTAAKDLPLQPLTPEAANQQLVEAALEAARCEADRQRERADALDRRNDELLAALVERDQAVGELKGVAGRQSIEILRLKNELRSCVTERTKLLVQLDALKPGT